MQIIKVKNDNTILYANDYSKEKNITKFYSGALPMIMPVGVYATEPDIKEQVIGYIGFAFFAIAILSLGLVILNMILIKKKNCDEMKKNKLEKANSYLWIIFVIAIVIFYIINLII